MSLGAAALAQPMNGSIDPAAIFPGGSPGIGWRRVTDNRFPDHQLWFKGILYGETPENLIAKLAAENSDAPAIVRTLDGHFGLILLGPGRILLAADPIGSVPVFITRSDAGFKVSGEASRLLDDAVKETATPDQVSAFQMSGFTLGDATLFGALAHVGAGCVAVGDSSGRLEVQRYYRYLPSPSPMDDETALSALSDCTLRILEKNVRSAEGRQIVVPLSAGLDSRLIASGLKELGCEDVVCVSYGHGGNYEMEAARRIADRLGYRFATFENSPSQQRAFFASEECRQFEAFADTFCAVPFQQDVAAVTHWSRSGAIAEDAIIINGQSGDYISGNHIPAALDDRPVSDDAAKHAVLDALIDKHYSLWANLKTPENLATIRNLLLTEIDALLAETVSQPLAYAVYEAIEFTDRQSKYVVQGQRSYEWAGHDWRLPLWDRDYLSFWSAAPLAQKRNQNLYRRMLKKMDWGGVWGDGFEFPQRVTPEWIKPIRFLAKVAHAPFGRARWHAFERHWIAYWTDIVCNYAVASYPTVALDNRGHRNAIAWHVDRFIGRTGLSRT